MRRRLLAGIVVLVLTVPLVFLLRDFIRDVLLIELMRIVWGVGILLDSLPQFVLWFLLLLTISVIAGRSLLGRPPPGQAARPPQQERLGQISLLSRWIERAGDGQYFRWSLSRYVGELTLDILARRERITPEQLRQDLRAGNLDLPPGVMTYLEYGFRQAYSRPVGWLSWLRSRWSTDPSRVLPDAGLLQVVQFLEEQMEVHDDHQR
jgi:hypothetical protein